MQTLHEEIFLEAATAVPKATGRHNVRGCGEVAAEGEIGQRRSLAIFSGLPVAAAVALSAFWKLELRTNLF